MCVCVCVCVEGGRGCLDVNVGVRVVYVCGRVFGCVSVCVCVCECMRMCAFECVHDRARPLCVCVRARECI